MKSVKMEPEELEDIESTGEKYATIRVRPALKRQLDDLLHELNKKRGSRKVFMSDLLERALAGEFAKNRAPDWADTEFLRGFKQMLSSPQQEEDEMMAKVIQVKVKRYK